MSNVFFDEGHIEVFSFTLETPILEKAMEMSTLPAGCAHPQRLLQTERNTFDASCANLVERAGV